MTEARSRAEDRPLPLWRAFGFLRGIAILGVLVNHAAFLALGMGEPFFALRWSPLGPRLAWAAPFLVTLQELTRFAVPLFFFLAGHFVARTPQTWHGFLVRGRRLLTPFLFWSLVGLGWSWTLFPPGASGWGFGLFAHKLLAGEAQLGYFFTVLLIQYQLLARWLIPLTVRYGLRVPWAALLIQLGTIAWSYHALRSDRPPFPEFLFPRFLFFYCLGIWSGLEPARLKAFLLRHRGLLLALLPAGALLLLAEAAGILGLKAPQGGLVSKEALLAVLATPWKASTFLWSLLFILGAVTVFLGFSRLSGWLWRLGMHSYPIYILQGPLFLLLYLVLSRGSTPSWLSFPAFLLGAFLGSILLTRLVRSRLPWAAPLVLGD